jgi:translin
VTGLAETSDGVRRRLEAKFAAREVGLSSSRQAIRRCANAIRAVHRGELDRARELLGEARQLLDVAESALAAHPDIYYAGFLGDAQKEYAEGRVTLAIVAGEAPPAAADLGIGDIPWLNGLAEVVGELRRHILDLLRAGNDTRASEVFAAMGSIHDLLTEIDFPDAMTSGLRRSTDVARAILERTRSDLTLTTVQRDLAAALRAEQPPPENPPG